MKVWLTIAPPLDARAPAPGKLPRGAVFGVGVDPASVEAAGAALPKSKKAGVDTVGVEKGLHVGDLRPDGLAEQRGLFGDGGAAEIGDACEHQGQRDADDRKPHCVRQVHAAAECIGQRVEADAEQHAGEDQEQGGGKIPGEGEQRRDQHDADAADRDGPGQVAAGPGSFISGNCHVVSFWEGRRAHSFAKSYLGSSRGYAPV
ncbi:hypothetical protein ACVJF1_008575 [Bradyrhizobium diazoefficiens]